MRYNRDGSSVVRIGSVEFPWLVCATWSKVYYRPVRTLRSAFLRHVSPGSIAVSLGILVARILYTPDVQIFLWHDPILSLVCLLWSRSNWKLRWKTATVISVPWLRIKIRSVSAFVRTLNSRFDEYLRARNKRNEEVRFGCLFSSCSPTGGSSRALKSAREIVGKLGIFDRGKGRGRGFVGTKGRM